MKLYEPASEGFQGDLFELGAYPVNIRFEETVDAALTGAKDGASKAGLAWLAWRIVENCPDDFMDDQSLQDMALSSVKCGTETLLDAALYGAFFGTIYGVVGKEVKNFRSSSEDWIVYAFDIKLV